MSLVFNPLFKVEKLLWIISHFQKLKFMNFLSVLHVERAYELKKGNFSVFFSQFGVKKEVILILLTWISSVLLRAVTASLNLQIGVDNSTSWIYGWHSVLTFPKVNNLCISTYWIEIQCSSCCYRWTLNYRVTCRGRNLSDSTARTV